MKNILNKINTEDLFTFEDCGKLCVDSKPEVVVSDFITIGGQEIKATFDLSKLDKYKHQMAIRLIQQQRIRLVGY